jgi:hypothetical protein
VSGEKYILRSIMACSSDKIEKNEMGGECSAYGVKERRIQVFGGET